MCLLYWVSLRVGGVEWYTAAKRCVCVIGVKYSDLCGSEGVVVRGLDRHSDAEI